MHHRSLMRAFAILSLIVICVMAAMLCFGCGTAPAPTSTPARSGGTPGTTAAAVPITAAAVPTVGSAAPEPASTTTSPTEPPAPITSSKPPAEPSTDEIAKILSGNGFERGSEKYFKNGALGCTATLDNGCDFSIVLTFDPSHDPDAQKELARMVLGQIYPGELVAYYDHYITDLSKNAMSNGQPLYAPSKVLNGFMIQLSNEMNASGTVLVSVFHPNTHYPVDMSSDSNDGDSPPFAEFCTESAMPPGTTSIGTAGETKFTYATSSDADSVSAFYTTWLPQNGWTITKSHAYSKVHTFVVTKGQAEVSIWVTKQDSGCTVDLTSVR